MCVDPIGTTTRDYTERNELESSSDPSNRSVRYEYDPAGNRIKVVYPSGGEVNYTFDALNRIKTIVPWTGGTTTYDYFKNSLLKKQTNGNGTTTDWAYDVANRLTSLINKRSNGQIITSHSYMLDKVGNIKEFPTNENPVQKPLPEPINASFDGSNRILSDGVHSFSHDPDGRITNGGLLGTSATYGHNDLDLLTSITNSTGQIFSAGYNGDGHRLFKFQNGTTTRYILDQSSPLTQVLVETNYNSDPHHFYIYGHGLVQQITEIDNSSAFYHFDHVGNTVAMTSSTEATLAAYNYAAYGRTKSSTAHHNPFRFVGRWGVQDDGNGLHCMRDRYYDQRINRFLSQDSVFGSPASPQSLARYSYGLGNPYGFVDPSGRTARNIKRFDRINTSLHEASETFDLPVDFLASVLEIENSSPGTVSTFWQEFDDIWSYWASSNFPNWGFADRSYGVSNMTYGKFATSCRELKTYYGDVYSGIPICRAAESDKLSDFQKRNILLSDDNSIMAMAGSLRYEIGRVNYNLKNGYLGNIPSQYLDESGLFPESGDELSLEQMKYLATRHNAYGYNYWVNSYGISVSGKVDGYRKGKINLKFLK